ncbi:hypothetical protein RyT2_14910 [Pseudolactococcus yaeyamensis]
MELTISGAVYPFSFNIGFLRDINKTVVVKDIEGVKGFNKNIGLRAAIMGLLDGDLEALVDILNFANKGCNPRLTQQAIEAFLEDETTDIDAVFSDVLEGLKQANATKKATLAVVAAVENNQAKQ